MLLPLSAVGFLLSFSAVEAGAGSYGLDLFFVNQSVAAKHGAKCLDGTLPGYYARIGTGGDGKKWRIHFRGGGWCFTDEECAQRAASYVGTSKFLQPNIGYGDSPFGFMNVSEPTFGNWTLVFVEYCDGSSWTSNRSDSTSTGNVTVWHRGRPNLFAVMESLDQWNGLLTDAEEIVFTGTSAGGLHVLLNGNLLKSMAPPTAKTYLLPDAGFFLFPEGDWQLSASMLRDGFAIWNSTAALLPECLAAVAEPWMCMQAPNILPHLQGPVFVLQSLYDTAQLNCDTRTPGCNTTMEMYRGWLQGNLTAAATSQTSVFGTACHQHEESCKDYDWEGIHVQGTSPSQSFASFYNTGNPRLLFDVKWPNNPTCSMLKHGAC